MKFVALLCSCVLIGMSVVGCTSLAPDKALKHQVVTLDNEIVRAESVKTGILNHAVIEGKQDSEEVKEAVTAIDAYIGKLKQQRAETEVILQLRNTPPAP